MLADGRFVLSVKFCQDTKYKRQRIGEVRRWVLLCISSLFLGFKLTRKSLDLAILFGVQLPGNINLRSGVCHGGYCVIIKRSRGCTILGGTLFARAATLMV